MEQRKRKGWLLLGAVNLLLILIGAVMIWRSHQESIYAVYDGVETDGNESLSLLFSTPAELKKGIYEVTVEYQSGGGYEASCFSNLGSYQEDLLYMDEQQLPAGEREISFRLWVTSDVKKLYIRFRADQPAPEIDVKSIFLKRRFRWTFPYLMLRLLAGMLVLDVVGIVLWQRNRVIPWIREHIYVILGMLAVFGINSLILMMNQILQGHDIAFHLARIAGLAEGMSTGEFPVRIQPEWCNGYGYPVSVFYGDLLLYFPAFLYFLGVPIVHAYKAYLLLIQVGTMGVAYYCYKRLSGDRYIGLFCMILSCLSISRILNEYTRAAVGEYSAFMFVPFVILGMKEILCPDENVQTGKNKSWLFLGIGMAGILYTHTISFEMTCIFLGITVLLQIKKILLPEKLWSLSKAALLAMGLSAGFLIPFLDYAGQGLKVFKQKTRYIQKYGLSLYELFSFPTEGTGVAKVLDGELQGRFPISLGIGVTLVILLEMIALARLTWEKKERRRLLFVSGLASLCVWMTTIYFPWDKLTEIPGLKSVVTSIQFPWRFFSLGIPLLTYMAGLLLTKLKACISAEWMKCILLCLCLVTALQGMYVVDLVMRSDSQNLFFLCDGSQILRSDISLSGGEYLLNDVDILKTRTDQEITGSHVSITDIKKKGNRIWVTVTASSNAYLDFPLFAYDHYRCMDVETGRELSIVEAGEENNFKIRVELPADYQGTLCVFFKEPWYWRGAEVLSLCTFTALIGYSYCICRKIRRRQKLTKSVETH